MKYCVICGAENPDSAKFCTECGLALNVTEANVNTDKESPNCDASTEDIPYTYGESSNSASNTTAEVITYGASNNSDETNDKYSYTYNADNNSHTSYSTVHPGIAPRNIVVAIILSIVTCGIYQFYWMFKMNEEVNTLANEPAAASGGLVILFYFITCGIYGIYWTYKMGERCDRIKGSIGGSSAILYLILTLLGFGIVTFCLIQDTINKAV